MTDSVAPPPGAPFAAPGQSATPPPPSSPGWGTAATAIHGLQQIARPVLMSITPDGHGSIAIDLRHQAYVWSTPLSEFPTDPADVILGTYPIDGEAPGLAGDTRGIDPLLWMIGLHAFPGSRASWLRDGDKYRLKWWPDLDLLPATDNQLRTVKTLVKSLMTVEKLAQLTKLSVDEVQPVVNALSLMGALRRIEGKGGSPVLPPMADVVRAQPDRVRGRHVKRGS